MRKVKKKKRRGGGGGGGVGEGHFGRESESERRGTERNEKSRERNFSLRSMEIGSWVFVRARGKVSPRNEGYAWVPKSWSFVKLHEVENFPTWIIF